MRFKSAFKGNYFPLYAFKARTRTIFTIVTTTTPTTTTIRNKNENINGNDDDDNNSKEHQVLLHTFLDVCLQRTDFLVTSRFRCGVNEVRVLLGCHAAQIGNYCRRFGKPIGPILKGQAVQEEGRLETSLRNRHLTPRKIPVERRPKIHSGVKPEITHID